MEYWMFILCVIPAIAESITISPNGNSPEIKMNGGMVADTPPGFGIKAVPSKAAKSEDQSSKITNLNSTKLALNERYRRLIPYMTFYYANDAVNPSNPTTQEYVTKNIEVEKAQIVEAGTLEDSNRQPKVIYSSHRYNNIPRYQGNRLTQHNIASANPTRFSYKDAPVVYQNRPKVSSNYNPLLDHNVLDGQDNQFVKILPKPFKSPSAPFTTSNRKPNINIYSNNNAPNTQYYIFEKEQVPKYKLVPYEQTPPIKYAPEVVTSNLKQHPAQTIDSPKEPVYIQPRPVRPQYLYDSFNVQSPKTRKPPTIISESYYEKRPSTLIQPVIESGFRPIVGSPIVSTEAPVYTSISPTQLPENNHRVPLKETVASTPRDQLQYQYVVDQPTYTPTEPTPQNTISLADLLNSLQLNKAIPKPITRENIGASIRTLLQVLTALKQTPQQNDDISTPVLSTPKPFEAPEILEVTSIKPVQSTLAPQSDLEFHEEAYLAPVNTPSQHLDDFPLGGSTSQRFPLPITSDDEGGTPGRPGVDYPILTVIPPTKFNCKTQRYKGFFADPETRCQVWHYCDLNGGQASFLCPNGTIFSQAGLTCDWWFNVRCASTTQLYVLNESLYKYILPHSPKFPEDYSGPLVDKYLTLKFKEMEEQFKKNKNKQTASEKIDSNEDDSSENSNETSSESSDEKESVTSGTNTNENIDKGDSDVSKGNVVIESPGTSGNVERLRDE